jgi:hypothetical protein
MTKLLLAASLLTALLATTARAEFWGSSASNRYHFKRCQWTPKIRKEYLVRFDTADLAVRAGYRPCEKCRPPLTERRSKSSSMERQQSGRTP